MSSFAISLIKEKYRELHETDIHERLVNGTYVNFDRKYMYMEVPKAGCTSMKALIRSIEKLPPLVGISPTREVRRDMLIHDRSQYGMKSVMDFNDAEQEKILTDPTFFRFSIVRDPFTRIESAWRDKVRVAAPKYTYFYEKLRGRLPYPDETDSLITLEEFIGTISAEDLDKCDAHWRRQAALLFYPQIPFTYIGKVENFRDAKRRFLEAIGLSPSEESRKLNTSEGSSQYTKHLGSRISELYIDDFILFGYDQERYKDFPDTPDEKSAPISEKKFLSEIVERNILLDDLYKQRENNRTTISFGDPKLFETYKSKTFPVLYDEVIAPIEGWLSIDEEEQLFEAAKNVTSGCIVEIGSYRGRSSVALALGSCFGHSRPVFCIEPHEDFIGPSGGQYGAIDRGYFMRRVVELGLFDIIRLVNLSSEFLNEDWPYEVKLLWIDGNLRYESVYRDWRIWKKKLSSDSVVIFNNASAPDIGPRKLIEEVILPEGEFFIAEEIGRTVQLRRR